MMKFLPVWPPIAFTTDGMSALTKLSMMLSCAQTADAVSVIEQAMQQTSGAKNECRNDCTEERRISYP
jgi:hypothetical protein